MPSCITGDSGHDAGSGASSTCPFVGNAALCLRSKVCPVPFPGIWCEFASLGAVIANRFAVMP